jgi:CopZ-like zinc binding protein
MPNAGTVAKGPPWCWTGAVPFRGHTEGVTEPCCSSDLPARSACPQCGAPATPVDTLTVKALVTPSALKRLLPGAFSFCATPACGTVYFSADQGYRTADIGVSVWQKEPFGERVVCYCFGENEADMRGEIESSGASEAVARVREHIAAKRCACEIRNPRGVCCLADVIAAVKRVDASRHARVSS